MAKCLCCLKIHPVICTHKIYSTCIVSERTAKWKIFSQTRSLCMSLAGAWNMISSLLYHIFGEPICINN